MLRSEEEVQTLRETLGWKDNDDIDQNDEASTSPNKGTRKTRTKRTLSDGEDEILQGSAFCPRKKSRLNMEALAQILAGDGDEDNVNVESDAIDSSLIGLEEVINQSDEMAPFGHDDIDIDQEYDSRIVVELSPSPSTTRHGQEDVIIDNWRPPTPDHAASNSRYEEEYD